MGYAFGVTVIRDRRRPVADPYNPSRQRLPEWSMDPETFDSIEIDGVYVAATSTIAVPETARNQSLDYRSLYSEEADVDILKNDRIRYGDEAFYVDTRPTGDINPFTGSTPGVEIPLRAVVG